MTTRSLQPIAITLFMIILIVMGTGACTPIQAPSTQGVIPQGSAIVQIESGAAEGIVDGDVIAFKGIPYAAPPIGDLRWREPQPVTPWTEVFQATTFGHDCMQVAGEEHIQTTPSEDCLYINIWKPVGIEPDAKLPVMVWIHGGGFVQGGSSDLYFDGGAFARQGIVVVSLNYRLGHLGFFAHPALLAASEGPVGNFGFMDQIAALQWVQSNIEAFGGDPAQVTIMGESAGGASVLVHLTSPASEGLFHQVVVMSGGGRKGLALRPMTGGTAEELSADQTDVEFAASLGIEGDGPDALTALRALSAEELVGNLDLDGVLKGGLRCVIEEVMAISTAATCVPRYDGTQMIDGAIVTAHPGERLPRGEMANVPMIIGTTAADVPANFPPSVLDPYPHFGEDAERARAHYSLSPAIAEALVASGNPELIALMPILAMGADMTMHEPARFAAMQMTMHGNSAWLYRFTYVAESTRPSLLGQKHAGEIPFLFHTLDASYPGAVTDKDQEIAQAFNAYISNFVKTGDPNGEGLPLWPLFDPVHYDLLDFTNDNGPVFGLDPRAEGVELVERAADAQEE